VPQRVLTAKLFQSTMAKKRRKEEEEEFKLPEFDEVAFLKKEITGAKMILVVMFLAIVAAVLSYVLTLAGVVVVAFFAGLAVVLLLKYIPKVFGVDTKGLERKDWFGYGSTYFFAWLAVWVLVMNVPFSDVTSPGLIVFVNNVQANPGATVSVSGTNVNISAKATDNAGINVVLIQVDTAIPVPMTPQGSGDMWVFTVSGLTSTKNVTVIAEDVNRHTTSVSITLMKG